MPTPNVGTRQNILSGVTCSSANDCWAVGYYNAGPSKIGEFTYPTLILRWNGVNWSIAPSANTQNTQNILSGVTCTSSTNCWAVGYTTLDPNGGIARTLIEQWDGVSWKLVPSPNTSATRSNYLFSVSCASSSECRAAGYSNTPGAADAQTVVAQWNGSTWAVDPSPNVAGATSSALFGIACPGAGNCFAAGYYDGANPIQTLIEHRDPTAWTIMPSPNSSATQQNVLNAVTCTSPFDCWAVGYYDNATGSAQTLIQHYVASAAPTITSVQRGAGGRFVIDGQALPLSTVEIQSAPTLSSTFTMLGTTTTNSSGFFHYEDTTTTGVTQRFYRALYP
jgi:hypothetical protein